MLYEMLTGQLPFDADSPVSVALKQIEMEPPMPRSINPEIPEGLEEITMRALQKDPEQRYQSAGEMLADIEEFKADPSVRFEYDYLTDPAAEKARCRRTILSLKKGKAPMKPDEAKRDTPRRTPRRRDGGSVPARGIQLRRRKRISVRSAATARRSAVPAGTAAGNPAACPRRTIRRSGAARC